MLLLSNCAFIQKASDGFRKVSSIQARGLDSVNYFKRKFGDHTFLQSYYLQDIKKPSELTCDLEIVSSPLPLEWEPSFIQDNFETINKDKKGKLLACLNDAVFYTSGTPNEETWHFNYIIVSQDDEMELLEVGEMVSVNGAYLRDGFIKHNIAPEVYLKVRAVNGSLENQPFILSVNGISVEDYLTSCRKENTLNEYGFYNHIDKKGFAEQALKMLLQERKIPEFYTENPKLCFISYEDEGKKQKTRNLFNW